MSIHGLSFLVAVVTPVAVADSKPLTLKDPGWIGGVAISPDGRTLASGGSDRKVRLRDLATGKVQVTLEGHTNAVCAVAFDRSARLLATASHDGTAMLWDVAARKGPVTLRGHRGLVLAVGLAPGGRALAAGGGGGDNRLLGVPKGRLPGSLSRDPSLVK